MRGVTAQKVLERLKKGCASGEEMARELGISRAAVWKAVKTLRSKGYEIVGGSSRGYALKECRPPSARTVTRAAGTGTPVFLFSVADSTNDTALGLLKEGCPHLTAVAANSQRAGRGRVGRKFFSPPGTGIYMSVVIRGIESYPDLLTLTPAAAVAAARAIKDVFGIEVKIKWVNDLYLDGKKVCGILTQSLTAAGGGILGAVVGIGINVTGEMPEELQRKARSLKSSVSEEERDALIGKIIAELALVAKQLSTREFMDEYRKRSCVIGEHITFEKDGITYFGTAENIDNDGALYVRVNNSSNSNNNNVIKLNTGEVSIIL